MKLNERLGVWPFLLLGIILFTLGLLALNHVINNWWPFDVNRLDLVRATALGQGDPATILSAANTEIILAFLSIILVMVTGLSLPLSYFLNKRFGHFASQQLAAPQFMIVLRQAMAVGLWVSFCVWLQMNRAFGIAIALLVAAVLILFELLLQIRARTADTVQ